MPYGLVCNLVASQRNRSKALKRTAGNGCADLTHEFKHEMHVVNRAQPQSTDLTGFVEMTQIGAAEGLAGVAGASRLDGAVIFGKPCIAKIDTTIGRQE